jgi:hypothetical protein
VVATGPESARDIRPYGRFSGHLMLGCWQEPKR